MPPAKENKAAKNWLTYIQIVGGLIVIASSVSVLWVTKDRQDSDRVRIEKIENDRAEKLMDYASKKQSDAAFHASVAAFIDNQNKLNAQIQQLPITVAKVETTLQGQQKQMDRVEATTGQILEIMRGKDKTAATASNSR